MSEAKPWMHFFVGSPRYAGLLKIVKDEARSVGWGVADFSVPGNAYTWLDIDEPDAFVSYLTPKKRGSGEDPARQQPVLDLIVRAHELEIPVALLTPRSLGSVDRFLDPNRDIVIPATLDLTAEALSRSPLSDWLGQTASLPLAA